MTEEKQNIMIGAIFWGVIALFAAPSILKWSYKAVMTEVITEFHKGIAVDMEEFHSRITGQKNPFAQHYSE